MRVAPRTGLSGRRLAGPGAALVCASLALLWTASVRAQEASPASTTSTAASPIAVQVENAVGAAGCPEAEEIATRIAELGQGMGDAPAPAQLLVRFERSEGRLTATLRLGDAAGARRLELQHDDCALSADAVAMAGTILIEEVMQERQEAARAQTAAAGPEPATVEVSKIAPLAEPPPDHDDAPVEQERDFNAWLALIAAPTWDMLSGLGGAGALRLELTWKRALLSGGAFATVPNAHPLGAGEISTWIAGAEFSGCARLWYFSASSELALCGLFSIAHLDVTASGFAQGLEQQLAWYAIGGTARVHGMLMSPLLGWYAGVSGIVPLQRDVFTVDGAGSMRSGALGLRAEIGVRCAID